MYDDDLMLSVDVVVHANNDFTALEKDQIRKTRIQAFFRTTVATRLLFSSRPGVAGLNVLTDCALQSRIT